MTHLSIQYMHIWLQTFDFHEIHTLSYKYTNTFKLHFIHTQKEFWPEGSVPQSAQFTGNHPITKLNLPPTPSPASQLPSLSSPYRAAGVTGWQECLGWLSPASQVVWSQETAPALPLITHSTLSVLWRGRTPMADKSMGQIFDTF